ncbi:MAG: YidC/Oxa1 family membrane protein insertase [Thermoflexaceae bacterium]|nr:YidC/Oxa1 family membrane protein insertase [Thermoflexaceae bacterium]
MIGDVFTLVLLDPMINFLVLLNNIFFGSFGLALIAFTFIIRLVTFPLTRRQLHQSRALQAVQPRMAEINKKYSDPKRRQEEMMKLYRDAGVNPLGCLGPMLLQFPILIALFYAIRQTLPESPEALEALSTHLYSWNYIQHAVPINEFFLGIDLKLSPNDASSYLSPAWLFVILVGATTWLQTKTTVTTVTDERARAQQQMMAYMMPIMFAFFALSFPTGVSLYWTVNSLIQIGFNIVTYGLPALNIQPLLKSPAPAMAAASATRSAQPPVAQPAPEPRTPNGPGRSKRQNRRRRPQ